MPLTLARHTMHMSSTPIWYFSISHRKTASFSFSYIFKITHPEFENTHPSSKNSQIQWLIQSLLLASQTVSIEQLKSWRPSSRWNCGHIAHCESRKRSSSPVAAISSNYRLSCCWKSSPTSNWSPKPLSPWVASACLRSQVKSSIRNHCDLVATLHHCSTIIATVIILLLRGGSS